MPITVFYDITDAEVYPNPVFGYGMGPIYFDRVQCLGSESDILLQCGSNYFHSCSHYNDVSISCKGTSKGI